MRYIRTKNNIYDTSAMSISSIYDNGVFVKNVSYCKRIDDFTLLNIYENEIIKQADIIEELCDEFVLVNSYCHKEPFLFPHEQANPLEEIWQQFDRDTICYGAIWTYKGLIYVAKMNCKGELELL